MAHYKILVTREEMVIGLFERNDFIGRTNEAGNLPVLLTIQHSKLWRQHGASTDC